MTTALRLMWPSIRLLVLPLALLTFFLASTVAFGAGFGGCGGSTQAKVRRVIADKVVEAGFTLGTRLDSSRIVVRLRHLRGKVDSPGVAHLFHSLWQRLRTYIFRCESESATNPNPNPNVHSSYIGAIGVRAMVTF